MSKRRVKGSSHLNGIGRRLRRGKDRRIHPFYRIFLSLTGYHRNVRSPFSRFMLALLTYACVFSVSTSLDIFSNPTGGEVVAGNAAISSPSSRVVQIHQMSNKAIINWQSFNIGAKEKTQFIQPSSHAIVLNRINPGQGVSQIYGLLKANGQIILINQAGIYFGLARMLMLQASLHQHPIFLMKIFLLETISLIKPPHFRVPLSMKEQS